MDRISPLPQLDETTCTACGDCIAACPTDCLAPEATGQPWLVRPGDCISCAVCVMVCPEEALAIDPIGTAGAVAG